jgi:hypothetical protein
MAAVRVGHVGIGFGYEAGQGEVVCHVQFGGQGEQCRAFTAPAQDHDGGFKRSPEA